MNNVFSNWQDSLNTSLVNRLNRPLNQPGMMKMSMSQRIINRCDRLLNRLPLLGQQMQRWGNVNTAVSNDVPIVYAQPVSLAKEQNAQAILQNQSSVPIIQRKEDNSQPGIIKSVNNITISENITPSLGLENQLNETSISSSQMPVISSQPISEEFTETGEMPLLEDFTNTYQQQFPIVQIKQQNYSLSSSHLPVTNPLNNFTSSKQTQLENNYENINFSNKENSVTDIFLTNLPIVATQPSTDKINSTKKEISSNINYSNSQNNYNLPVVPIISPIIPPEKPQSLPLTKNSSSSQIINNSQPNLSNHNSSAPPKVLPLPSSPTETIVSPLANQSNSTNANIDVDTIVNQVERKLMRRLVIESERRGKTR